MTYVEPLHGPGDAAAPVAGIASSARTLRVAWPTRTVIVACLVTKVGARVAVRSWTTTDGDAGAVGTGQEPAGIGWSAVSVA